MTIEQGEIKVEAVNDQAQYLYITTTGRVTGKLREIEIWFVQANGKFYILAEHQYTAHWVMNISKNPHVYVRVGSSVFEASVRVLREEHDREVWKIVQGLMLEKYEWDAGLPVEIVPNTKR